MTFFKWLNPKKKWWITGLLWGFFMWVAMTIVLPLIDGSGIRISKLLISIPVWAFAGLLYGFVINAIEKKKRAIDKKETKRN